MYTHTHIWSQELCPGVLSKGLVSECMKFKSERTSSYTPILPTPQFPLAISVAIASASVTRWNWFLSHFCLVLSSLSHCFYSHSDTSHLSPGFLLSLVPSPSSLLISLCSYTPGLEEIFPESCFSTPNILLLTWWL